MAQRIRVSGPPTRPIPSIKYFGTTWYERGSAYWRRRFWLTALALLATLAVLGAIAALIFGLAPLITSPIGRIGAVLAAVIPVTWSCYSAYRTLRRSPEDRAAHRPMSFRQNNPENLRAAGAAGVATGILAGGLVAFGSLFVVGQIFGFLVITLGKYVNDEEWRLARQYGLEK